ncbi:hypothetical protein B566_EDAN011840 [Ephemera danica]|nr:hypothetical protein B566_EDAN011840 [Ephemera danica]
MRLLQLFFVLQIYSLVVITEAQPNVIIIVADDLGWNDVAFHGSNQVPTPNIDALAFSGVILNNYYVMPMCTPSRAALMTGRHPIHTGMTLFHLTFIHALWNSFVHFFFNFYTKFPHLMIIFFEIHISCITGMQHHAISVNEPWGLGLEHKLMPEYLKDERYATHIVGKWHLGLFHKEYTPTFRGFDSHFGYWGTHQDYMSHILTEDVSSIHSTTFK